MVSLEELNVYVRESPEESYDWNTNTVQFENGAKQYQQTWTKPEKTITFTTTGLKDYMDYLISFYNARKGGLEKFYCDVYRDGNKKIYRFNGKLSIKWYYEVTGKKVGGSTQITLVEEKE